MRNAEIGRLVGVALGGGRPVGVAAASAVAGHDDEPRMTVLPDTGCNLEPRCLSCSRPACKYDVNVYGSVYGRRTHELRRAANEAELLALLAAGARLDGPAAVADMARTLGISTRTMYRLRRKVTS